MSANPYQLSSFSRWQETLQASGLTDIIHSQPINLLGCTPLHRLDYNILEEKIMKPVKNLVFAVLLLTVLAFNTVAGDIQTPGAAAQPSPTPTAMTYSGAPVLSDPYPEQSGETVETSDYLFFEAIKALLSLY
jgi:hypothetical protein